VTSVAAFHSQYIVIAPTRTVAVIALFCATLLNAVTLSIATSEAYPVVQHEALDARCARLRFARKDSAA
jgi:hypothetical protein